MNTRDRFLRWSSERAVGDGESLKDLGATYHQRTSIYWIVQRMWEKMHVQWMGKMRVMQTQSLLMRSEVAAGAETLQMNQ